MGLPHVYNVHSMSFQCPFNSMYLCEANDSFIPQLLIIEMLLQSKTVTQINAISGIKIDNNIQIMYHIVVELKKIFETGQKPFYSE